MNDHCVYHSGARMRASAGDPIRAVVAESEHTVIVAWRIAPGQTIVAHAPPPNGQGTRTILSGEGDYPMDEQGTMLAEVPRDIVVARKGQVYGTRCPCREPLRFASVLAPLDAGFIPLAQRAQ